MRVFVAGDRSHVGKSSVCLTILAHLKQRGEVAYIKPATQSEAGDTVSRWCKKHNVKTAKSPLVFYPGFTRSVIPGRVSLENIASAVDEVCKDCKFCVIDGVGFPATSRERQGDKENKEASEHAGQALCLSSRFFK